MGTSTKSNQPSAAPSSNWLALKKNLKTSSKEKSREHKPRSERTPPRKRRRLDDDRQSVSSARTPSPSPAPPAKSDVPDLKNGESLSHLRRMIAGALEESYTANQRTPGKYLALDCEMVGVGIEGKESSLARVSLVNFHGAVQLDVFVRQRERVVDYRTEFSGVRPSDMNTADPFTEVQKQVAELIKDRILVGHAVFNDLKALLLSHPSSLTRDTQHLAGRHKLTKTKRPALRHLVEQELGVAIQRGEHSSVTDARATMAVFRLHRKEWEKGLYVRAGKAKAEAQGDAKAEDEEDAEASPGKDGGKRKRKRGGESQEKATGEFPGGGRKGVSSGLGVVVKRHGADGASGKGNSGVGRTTATAKQWWNELE